MCDIFFSDCLIHLVSKGILAWINDTALFGKDAFDWIQQTFSFRNKLDIYFAIKECYGKVMTDDTDARNKANAFINDMFGYNDLSVDRILAINTLI